MPINIIAFVVGVAVGMLIELLLFIFINGLKGEEDGK